MTCANRARMAGEWSPLLSNRELHWKEKAVDKNEEEKATYLEN